VLLSLGRRRPVEECFESVQLKVPQAFIERQPFEGAPQRYGDQATAALAALQAPFDQAGALEDAEVLRHRWQRHVERLGQRQRGRIAFGRQPRENAASRRIGQRAEDAVEVGDVRSLHGCSLGCLLCVTGVE
jgi:hypothetical protein